MGIKQVLKEIDDAIFGVRKNTPSDFAYKKAKLKGTKRVYEHNNKRIDNLERLKKQVVISDADTKEYERNRKKKIKISDRDIWKFINQK